MLAAFCLHTGLAGAETAQTIEATAFTAPFRNLEISTDIRGILDKVHVEEGDLVKKGQDLVELNTDVLKAQLAVDEARVASAKLQVAAARSTHSTRKSEYERIQELYKQNVVSVDQYDKAKLEMDLAHLAVENALAEQRVNELTVIRDQAQIDQKIIRAPLDGQVFRILKRAGEAAEEQRPILTLVTIDPLYVIGYLPIRAGGRVEAGMPARFFLDDSPDQALQCEVAVADRVGDAASGTYRVKLTLPNPDRAITAGSKGRVVFSFGQ